MPYFLGKVSVCDLETSGCKIAHHLVLNAGMCLITSNNNNANANNDDDNANNTNSRIR